MESVVQEVKENPGERDSDAPAVCKGCIRWEKFGKNCFYYWELKKHCTMWTSDPQELKNEQQLM